MPGCDSLIRNVRVLDGSGGEPYPADVAIDAGLISARSGNYLNTAPGRLRRETDGCSPRASSMCTRMTIPA